MPRKILVVDKEHNITRLVEHALMRAGYDVIVAYDGREALEKVRSETPDMVVTEITLPYMDGYALLRELKQDPNTADIPFFVLSEKATDADVFRAWQSGVDCFLKKPFNQIELIQYVTRVFDQINK